MSDRSQTQTDRIAGVGLSGAVVGAAVAASGAAYGWPAAALATLAALFAFAAGAMVGAN